MNQIISTLTFYLISSLAIIYAQCPEIIWQDEFEKNTLDETKWSFQNGDGCDIGLCGWGNNELQWYQPKNAVVSDGSLKILARKEKVGKSQYTSAKLRTKGKADWTYGRFEASIKLPKGRGLWPAFWLLPTDEVYGGWPRSGEIDIVELIGDKMDEIHGSMHFGKVWPNNSNVQASYHLNKGEFSDEFHTFAIEWEEGEIRWLLDDHLYSTQRSEDIAPLKWPFDQNFHIVLNIAVGGTWPGNPDETTSFPQAMEVEYIRVFDGFFPSISGKSQVDKNSKEITYAIHNVPKGASIQWEIPAGAELISGKGTEKIIVNWGETGGDIKATINDACNSKEITINVMTLEPEVKIPVVKVKSIENFDTSNGQMKKISSAGIYVDKVKNPRPVDFNTKDLVAKYTRNPDSRYDVFVCTISDLNIQEFIDGKKKFFIDIYTDAPAGTEILFQSENNKVANGGNYPTGRHSRFSALTTKQNEWERLELEFQNQPDNSVNSEDVNQYLFLFAPNSNTNYTFYMDNFDIYVPDESGN
ncbi:MAG: family 16 glycosylhydrolase [Saprospiraceae bacterium]|nr:family 16 glycosylhydrolase [Saprospiraceae bacterium]